jgi:hypothetical protein
MIVRDYFCASSVLLVGNAAPPISQLLPPTSMDWILYRRHTYVLTLFAPAGTGDVMVTLTLALCTFCRCCSRTDYG